MHHRRAANERAEEAHHEIDRVVRRQDAQVPDARPKGIERGQRDALFEIIFVRDHAALRTAAGPRGIHDARDVPTLARNKLGFARAAEFFPALRTMEVRIGGGFRDEHGAHATSLERIRRRKLAPDRILRDEHAHAGMLQQLPMFVGRQLVIQGHKHASTMKDGIG